mgnify:FL=1
MEPQKNSTQSKTLTILAIAFVVIAVVYLVARYPSSTGAPSVSQTPDIFEPVFVVADGTYCYTRTQLATTEAPYSSEEHIEITIDGTTVSGTKAGTQAGPGVSNGFWGDLDGTLSGTAMELVYSYTVEGSEGKELELYEVSDSALTKLRYVLTEQGDTLVPDRTGEPTRLVYTLEQCTE